MRVDDDGLVNCIKSILTDSSLGLVALLLECHFLKVECHTGNEINSYAFNLIIISKWIENTEIVENV